MVTSLLLGIAALSLPASLFPPPHDLDGDGIAEVLGEPSHTGRTNARAVTVRRGPTGPPLTTIGAGNPVTAFGCSTWWTP